MKIELGVQKLLQQQKWSIVGLSHSDETGAHFNTTYTGCST